MLQKKHQTCVAMCGAIVLGDSMTVLLGVLIYTGVLIALLSFFRFVHRCDDVMRVMHAELPPQHENLESQIAHNRVA